MTKFSTMYELYFDCITGVKPDLLEKLLRGTDEQVEALYEQVKYVNAREIEIDLEEWEDRLQVNQRELSVLVRVLNEASRVYAHLPAAPLRTRPEVWAHQVWHAAYSSNIYIAGHTERYDQDSVLFLASRLAPISLVESLDLHFVHIDNHEHWGYNIGYEKGRRCVSELCFAATKKPLAVV